MTALPTVKVQHPNSDKHWIVINKKDYDPSKHKLWDESKEPEADDTLSDYEAREIELNNMGWRDLKKLLEDEYGGDYITKDQAIPLILSIEYPENDG